MTVNVKKYLRKKNQLRYLKNLGLLYLQAKNLKYIESTEQTISLKKNKLMSNDSKFY